MKDFPRQPVKVLIRLALLRQSTETLEERDLCACGAIIYKDGRKVVRTRQHDHNGGEGLPIAP
jgi:hypothetical protein